MKKLITLAFIISAAAVFGACEETDLGRYCVVGFDNESGLEGVKAINAEAPECLDRICVFQASPVTTEDSEIETIQYCSKKCGSDGDCSGGDKSNCSSGFICIRIGEESEDLNSKCICECRDFLTAKDVCQNRCKTGDSDKDDACNQD
ncbi:MAG: hypothetical protein JXR95_00885 [Deltaproteobacteria bacterium]|nr:hypothetical protein [Deltaproteobacteria bacterium]